jgi:hypothetical protein
MKGMSTVQKKSVTGVINELTCKMRLTEMN